MSQPQSQLILLAALGVAFYIYVRGRQKQMLPTIPYPYGADRLGREFAVMANARDFRYAGVPAFHQRMDELGPRYY